MLRERKTFAISSYSLGGALIIMLDLAKALGFQKVILNENLKNNLTVEGAKFVKFGQISKSPKTWFPFLLNFFKTFFTLFNETKDCSTALVNDLIPLFYIFWYKPFTRTKVFYFCHICFRETTFNRLILSKFINLVSDSIIVPSKYLELELIKLGVDKRKISQVYNGIDEVCIETANKPESELLTVGLFGLIDDLKGHDIFVEAISLLNKENVSVKGIIAGPIGDKLYFNKIQQIYSEQFKSGVIEYIGTLSHSDLLKLMSTIDIIVCTSKYRETLPTVLIEAMMLKKPIVGTRIGGIPEIIVDGLNGLIIEPSNSEQLKEKLLLLRDNDIRRIFGRNGYFIYKDKFAKNKFVSDFLCILNGFA